ncbi:MAG: acetyl-CoA C-acyltransferase [Alphaproteobacteria bacterium]|nr:acetyl-CoA C-acyltransferase [Alphaproteobacteria bacterium]
MRDVFIFDGVRTPFGRYGGILAGVRTDDLLAAPIRELMKRTDVPGGAIEDVLAGDTNQAGEDARNVARAAALLAGLPHEVAGQTVNRLCGSSLAALLDAARAVRCGEGDLTIAAGVESMTRAPLILAKAEGAFARAQGIADSTIGWRFPHPRLMREIGADSMPETAENVAKLEGISREACDAFAAASQARYQAARREGFFADEIMSLALPAKGRGPAQAVAEDEHPRADTTYESLARLKPLHEGGVVTAGNASGVNDGAVALLLGTADAAARHGLKPRARILAGAVVGVEPRLMGLGPVGASAKALSRAGLALADMDVIELNEAFAAQVLGCLKRMGLAADDPRLNPNGGAIAIGHPLGASGGRLALTALRELERRGGRYALVTLCIGIGQGIAAVVERVP